MWDELAALAEAEVADVLAALPPAVRGRLGELPITFEPQPNDDLVAAGLPRGRTMGLFTGVPWILALAVSQRLPPQIILFLDNLWDWAEHDPARFRAQVRRTLLHEIGHFLGLDEQGVRRRGL